MASSKDDEGHAAPPGAQTYRTTILLRARDTRKLTGRIKSLGRGCTGGRKLRLKRGKKMLKTTTSKANGSFKFKRTKAMRGRRVRVTVSARRRPTLICAAGA